MSTLNNLASSLKFNSKSLADFNILVTEDGYPEELLAPPTRTSYAQVAGKDGAELGQYQYDNWSFSIEMVVQGDNHADMINNRDQFLQWVLDKDIELELCGHKYWYTDGTVSIAEDSTLVTGQSTRATSYIYPGTKFKCNAFESTVQSVVDDTHWYLEDKAPTEYNNVDYKVERRRYLTVRYDGTASEVPISHAHYKTSHYTMNLSFLTTRPYFYGDKFNSTTDTVSTATYHKLYGAGYKQSRPKLRITGTSIDTPVVIVPEYLFSYDGLKHEAIDIDNSTISSSNMTAADHYVVFDNGAIAKPYSDSNYVQFSFYCEFITDSTLSAESQIFKLFDDSEAISLYYDHDTKQILCVESGGTSFSNDNITLMTNSTYYIAGNVQFLDEGDDGITTVQVALNSKLIIDESQVMSNIFSNMVDLDHLSIGSDIVGSWPLDGYITKFALYPRLFSTDELLHRRTINHDNKILTIDDTVNDVIVDVENMKCYEHDGTNWSTNNMILDSDVLKLLPDTQEQAILYMYTSANDADFTVNYRPRWV